MYVVLPSLLGAFLWTGESVKTGRLQAAFVTIYSGSVEKAFLDPEGDFDICINCAAETRYGQSEQVSSSHDMYMYAV